MGRELRMVPPNWEHPKEQKRNYFSGEMEERYIPMHDQSYGDAITEWISEHQLWEKKEHPRQKEEDPCEDRYFAEYGGDAPEMKCYRPDWKPGEATWFQMYETVSEGTPVTPPFATKQELIDYLVEGGDFWDRKRRAKGGSHIACGPWKRENAERMVLDEMSAPTFVVSNGVIKQGRDVI